MHPSYVCLPCRGGWNDVHAGALKVYDLRAGFHPRKEVAGAHTGDVRCVAFQHRASAPTLGASGDGGGRVGGAGATAGGAHDSDSSSAAAVGVALGVRRGSAGDGSLDGGSGPRGGVSARNPLVRTALLNAAAVAASRATRPTTTTDQLEASLDREWPRTPTPPLDEGVILHVLFNTNPVSVVVCASRSPCVVGVALHCVAHCSGYALRPFRHLRLWRCGFGMWLPCLPMV